ncbi:hypothetical protein J132_06086 [Termitomyces sp. J132]|nr:hypothetical protein J132_06086 [Termitomyces sp. J132]
MSEVFSDTFALPTVEGAKTEGSWDHSPFHLEGISMIDFKAFLRALIKEVHRDSILSRKEWGSALKLANMWGFHDVRQRAINAIEQAGHFTVVDKINLGREFKVFHWFNAAVQQFAFREVSISAQEVGLIGLDMAVPLFHLREKIVRHGVWHTSDWMKYAEDSLKEELLEVKASSAAFDALPSFYPAPKP